MSLQFITKFISIIVINLIALHVYAQNPTMGYIGCYINDIARGYAAVGGQRMWPPYISDGYTRPMIWTESNSTFWHDFDRQSAQYGLPEIVWVQLCQRLDQGLDYTEARLIVANAREHAAPGASIYITGQPEYIQGIGFRCPPLPGGVEDSWDTNERAHRAGRDKALNVTFPGTFVLLTSLVSDSGCDATPEGQRYLGRQALEYWG